MLKAAVQKKLLPWLKAQCGYFSLEQSNKSDYKVLLLPRKSYFETYKTYPLSVGRDIQKIASIEGQQVSPYNQNATVLHFIIKQADKFLVYYFVLHPKYSTKLDSINPWLIVPESLLILLKVNRSQQGAFADKQDTCIKDESGIWISSLNQAENARQASAELAELLKPQWLVQTFARLHNPKLITSVSAKFQRWQQVKLVLGLFTATALYFALVSGYQYGVNYFLDDKRSASAPVVSEIFQIKSQVDELKSKHQEFSSAYAEPVNNAGALIFVESLQSKHQLDVKRFRFFGNRVLLEAEAKSANGLLAELSQNEFVAKASLQGDIRKTGSGGRLEVFTIEFYWEDKLWR